MNKTYIFRQGDSTVQIEVNRGEQGQAICFYMFLRASTAEPTSYQGNNGPETIGSRKEVTHCGEASYEFDISDVIVDNLGNEYARANG